MEEKFLTCAVGEKEGTAGAAVTYRGKEVVFSNAELVAMFLNKLKTLTHAETKAPVSDVVISVPAFFTEKERRALVDAAEIAGLNCVRTINDTTAAAISYGMTKSDIPTDTPKLVVIVDIGYASMKACLVSFVKGKAEVKAHVFDTDLGGRDFDESLANHFVEQFIKKRNINIRENKKALLRLRVACEKMKKVLSSVQLTRLELEALVDGIDFPLETTRQLLEELTAPLVDAVEKKLVELLQTTGIPADKIDSVEIIGGTTRIPAVKARISQVFGKEVSTTLSADEAVSRGCALQCAIESPLVRVREYKIFDVAAFPIKALWTTLEGQVVGECVVFPSNSELGKARTISPLINTPFILEAHYDESASLPKGTPSQIAKFTISAPKSASATESSKIAVKILINASGMVEVPDAVIETESTEPGVAQEGEDPAASIPPRVITRSFPLTVKVESFRASRAAIQKMKEAEIEMMLNDKLVAEIDDRRNAVEELIYESRSKLEDVYAAVCSQEEKESVLGRLNETEEWLYGDGADAGQEEYVKKFDELQGLVKPFSTRIFEQEQAKKAAEVKNSTPEDAFASNNVPEVPVMDMD